MNCPECGAQLSDEIDVNVIKCPNCGAKVEKSTSVEDSSEVYNCDTCGEELEYITTYKQWYCYTCQTYMDHPAPTEIRGPKTDNEPVKLEDHLNDPGLEHDQNSDHAEDKDEHISWSISQEELGNHDDEPNESLEWVDDKHFQEDDESDDEIDDESDDESDDKLVDDEESEFEDLEDVDIEDFEDDDDDDYEPDHEEKEGEDDFELEEDEVDLGESIDEDLRKEVEDFEPEPKIELGESSIEEVSENDVEVEFFDHGSDFEIEETDDTISVEPDLKQKALAKAHSAWLKVNDLKKMYPDNQQIQNMEHELKEILKGDADPGETLIIAEESIEELVAIEKELLNNTHDEVSNIFHIINSKILLARKIGFDVTNLEEELDKVTSLIAMGKYKDARKGLKACSKIIRELPEVQSEILIGLEEGSELIDDLLEQLPDT
jgi:predicted RNA-binding Zn-ribbon protein involved in translation (DUF1610 family)